MPELPEVETIVRELNESDLIGLKIVSVAVYWPRTIAGLSVEKFCSQLTNQTIERVSRRGKFIVIRLNRETLLIHLRMTGKITLSNEEGYALSHERLRLTLSDGRTLHFADQRKFGKWSLEANPEILLDKLGLEPLSVEFTPKAFQAMLKLSTQAIKPFILDQKHVVGIGNIYSDEALWLAKIHPLKKANQLTPTQSKALHQAIIKVLELGIANKGTSLGSAESNYFSVSRRRGRQQDQLHVFRQEGLPCPRCQQTIIKIKVAQRGTHLCPHCQRL
jgi:formamidopyrimidine-DNA glycosylase